VATVLAPIASVGLNVWLAIGTAQIATAVPSTGLVVKPTLSGGHQTGFGIQQRLRYAAVLAWKRPRSPSGTRRLMLRKSTPKEITPRRQRLCEKLVRMDLLPGCG